MERSSERKGTADGNRNGNGTAKGETGGSEEDNRDRKQKGFRWWGMRRSNEKPKGEGVPIIFGTYNIQNGRNGGMESALG